MSKILTTITKFANIVEKLDLAEEKRDAMLDDLLQSTLQLAMAKTLKAFPQTTQELRNLGDVDWQEFKTIVAEKNVLSPEFSERLDKELENILVQYVAEITPTLDEAKKAAVDKILQA